MFWIDLIKSFAFLPAAATGVAVSSNLPYLFVLTALTNCGASCLAFLLAYSIPGPNTLVPTLAALNICKNASVKWPAAVALASSSAWFSIIPKIVLSKALLNLSVTLWSTSRPSPVAAS